MNGFQQQDKHKYEFEYVLSCVSKNIRHIIHTGKMSAYCARLSVDWHRGLKVWRIILTAPHTIHYSTKSQLLWEMSVQYFRVNLFEFTNRSQNEAEVRRGWIQRSGCEFRVRLNLNWVEIFHCQAANFSFHMSPNCNSNYEKCWY